jgi:hypothetical protein
LIAPLALNDYYGGFTTQLTVLNAGANATTVTVTFYGQDGTLQAGATRTLTLAAHTAQTLDQAAATSNIPVGFNGWAQVTGANNTDLLTAQVLEQNPNNRFVALVNSRQSGQPNQYAPAIFDDAYGHFFSGVNIINPNPTTITVNVTYYKYDGTSIPTTPFQLAPRAVAGVYQGVKGNINGLPAGGLPTGFYGGMIVTGIGGGVVVMANEEGGTTAAGTSRSGTYAAAASGASVIALPAVANNGFGFTSGATIFNISNTTVTGTIQYYTPNGVAVGSPQAFTVSGGVSGVAPNLRHGSHAVYQGASSLPNGFYGTAIITQTGGPANALVATTNMESAGLFYTYTEPSA